MTVKGATRVWTPERDEILETMWAEKAEVTRIARRLGVSEGAVLARRQRRKLPARTATGQFAPTWTDPERVEKLKQLWREGHSAGQVAKILSRDGGVPITRNAVISKIHRLGLNDTSREKRLRVKIKRPKPKPKPAPTPAPRVMLAEAASQTRHKRALRHAQLAEAASQTRHERALRHAQTVKGAVPLAELRHDHCRWPVGEGLYCGKFRTRGAYCEQHAKEAYVPIRSGKGERNPVWRIT